MDHQESRLMAISHGEFLRSLQPMKRDYRIRVEDQGRRFLITRDGLDMEILLAEEQIIRMGALSMPRTQVDFIFHGASPQQVSDFFSRFELSFRRGGG
ncbi:MAG: hypothetical protein JAY99_04265 [Candidatus Thiodiazotropha lotti]|nr:hypothetical protein [Candidatus Thiodiazotropha endoloripes]MCG7900422.1 hypothetical protein [Candidatus Thiodiazotropha weberae]MCG7998719.1 hypothetical protein [Candidatus Thiodiazotropha lotti]MCG7903310.1 hypothetical protein [Candidatus Thiodiazotropha weberae]MCG7915272.1 hypothetical protein [Candidatus Thiodiazotropha weberae]MCW4190485.1 hypothetical protein [Candidatus Thiodiazotropha weberae]